MFLKGIVQLLQTGVLNYLKDNYEGDFIPSLFEAETMVLTAGQVLLTFIIIGAALLVSSAIFLFELCYSVMQKRKSS